MCDSTGAGDEPEDCAYTTPPKDVYELIERLSKPLPHRIHGSSKTRGLCVACLTRPQRTAGRHGYGNVCQPCHDLRQCPPTKNAPSGTRKRRMQYRAFKKTYCEECNFIAVHSCQLDVDHADGDRFNNDPKNLITLCANCHRLKTQHAADFQNQQRYGYEWAKPKIVEVRPPRIAKPRKRVKYLYPKQRHVAERKLKP
jgi:hypothetical protein